MVLKLQKDPQTKPSLLCVEKTMEVIVEHPEFGKGEILEINYETGDPLISVEWDSGKRGCYWVEELEFLRKDAKVFQN